MSYFAAEMQKNWRCAPPSLLFGRYFLENLVEKNRYGAANEGMQYWSEVEMVMNRIGAAVVAGSPLIRCNMAGGGAESVVYNTYVAGGAGSGTSTDGCFLNFCGVAALQVQDNAAGNEGHRQLFVVFPSITTVPAVGSVLTQAVSLATGTVIASSTVFGYVQVIDRETGTWNATNVVTDSGLAMVPAAPIPRNLVYGTLEGGALEGNIDSNADDAGIWAVIRGYAPAFVQGDDSGLGYNGDIADCSPLTWSDNEICLSLAGFQNLADHTTVDVYVNGDNVIAHAMQAAGDNSGHLKELILVYMRADEPLVNVTNSLQGSGPSEQR